MASGRTHADGGSAGVQVGDRRVRGKVGAAGPGVNDGSVGWVELVVGGTMGIKLGR